MRICLIGDISGNIDEGMKKISYKLFEELKRNHEVILLNPLEIITRKKKLNNFKPDIIHYLMGPSLISFLLIQIAAFGLKSKIVMSITHPKNSLPKILISLIRVDLILVQAEDMEKFFNKLGFRVKLFPNGVDISKYRPYEHDHIQFLREKYQIEKNKFVLLHVGNIREGRNIKFLKNLSDYDNIECILIGSSSVKTDSSIFSQIKNSKIRVFNHYVEKLEDIYNLSDLYVFPVMNRPYAIDFPLSVLEAMSCNIPVITTKFGGIPFFFQEGKGLFFLSENENITSRILKIKELIQNSDLNIDTRSMVEQYSWEIISKKLENEYSDLLDEDRNEGI